MVRNDVSITTGIAIARKNFEEGKAKPIRRVNDFPILLQKENTKTKYCFKKSK